MTVNLNSLADTLALPGTALRTLSLFVEDNLHKFVYATRLVKLIGCNQCHLRDSYQYHWWCSQHRTGLLPDGLPRLVQSRANLYKLFWSSGKLNKFHCIGRSEYCVQSTRNIITFHIQWPSFLLLFYFFKDIFSRLTGSARGYSTITVKYK